MASELTQNDTLDELTPAQELVIAALLSGGSVTAAAKAGGVSRARIYAWYDNPAFAAVLTERRRQMREGIDTQLHGLAENAIDVLSQALTGRKVSIVRFRAAQDVLDRLERADVREMAKRLTESPSNVDTGNTSQV